MKLSNLILAIIAFLILLAGSLIFGILEFLRGAAGLLFVLFFPGWAITSAFFSERAFGIPERLALSVGFSIAASILTGLALHLTPWGLQTGIWILLLAVISAGTFLVSLLRRQPGHELPISKPAMLQPVQIGLIAMAVLMAVISITIARRPTPASGFEGYTSLWIHPLRIDEGYALQLGVSSMEFETTTYRLELQQDGSLIAEYPEITLAPGESTQVVTSLSQDQVSEGSVQALLFRRDVPGEPYRQVTWWPGDGRD